MSYKISKELFEAITGNKYGDLHFEKLLKNYDKLCFDCKKWAKPYRLKSYSNDKGTGICEINIGDTRTITKKISPLGEQQSIFDACQWVLDNKDKQ